MDQNNQRFEILEKLGLTEYEAKTLNVLFSKNDIDAQSLSRASLVPKTRVYDVLERLLSRNLIIEINGRPKRYRAVNPEQAIDTLISLKKEQVILLEKDAHFLKESLMGEDNSIDSGEKVLKVKKHKDFDIILAQELANASNSIYGLTEIDDDHTFIPLALEKAKERNVTIKILNHSPVEKLKQLGDVKQIEHGLNAFIIDDKKVVLAISDFKKKKSNYHFTIMNDHEIMASVLSNYFKEKWEKAKYY
jgi:HTH-type transcriptional regulator, sugar sensing transcriptional regulator